MEIYGGIRNINDLCVGLQCFIRLYSWISKLDYHMILVFRIVEVKEEGRIKLLWGTRKADKLVYFKNRVQEFWHGIRLGRFRNIDHLIWFSFEWKWVMFQVSIRYYSTNYNSYFNLLAIGFHLNWKSRRTSPWRLKRNLHGWTEGKSPRKFVECLTHRGNLQCFICFCRAWWEIYKLF